jgi:tetratricopeptide (TPR) repeat protein
MHARIAARVNYAAAALVWALASVSAFGQSPAAPSAPAPAASAPVTASPTDVRLELLRDRWSSSAENRERAPQLYSALQKGASYVPADDFLYGLVRFEHNQYDEAEAAIDRALQRSPDDLMFLKTRVWIALTRKRYDQALTALTKFQEVLFAEGKEKATTRPASARSEDLTFLGQVHGYLATVAERVTTPESFEELRDAVAEGLSLDELRTFEAAERETQVRYENLVAEKEAAVASFTEAADAAAVEKMTDFDERRRQLQERRADLDGQLTSAVEAAKAEVGNLAAAQLQARQATGALMNQLAPARQQYSRQLESIERLRNSLIAVQFSNGAAGAYLQAELQTAQQQAAAMEAQLQIAERNYAQASSALINVNREIAVKQASHGQKVGELERGLRQIDGEVKKLDKEEEKELGKGAGTTVAIRQMSQKIGALGSYVDYDPEIPRLKLIQYLERR